MPGKLVAITGGSSGIGLALAEALPQLGFNLVLIANNASRLQDAAAKLEADGRAVSTYVCDIGAVAAVERTCSEIIKKHGTLDILVNNAGFATYRLFEQIPSSELEQLIVVNFGGAMRVTQGFLAGMKARKSGHKCCVDRWPIDHYSQCGLLRSQTRNGRLVRVPCSSNGALRSAGKRHLSGSGGNELFRP
jgi:short-subunit dehydrogenase